MAWQIRGPRAARRSALWLTLLSQMQPRRC